MSETLLFKTFCLEQYKDVLHKTGAEYLVEEIDLFIKTREETQ